jgi:rare lipoprotein A
MFHCFFSTVVVFAQNEVAVVRSVRGTASFYAMRFHGNKTSNGERLDNNDLTCATPKLPFGTYLRVTNLKNSKQVVVRVTDRLKQRGNHIIDLTQRAAREIDMIASGRCNVLVEVLSPDYGFEQCKQTEAFSPLRKPVLEPFYMERISVALPDTLVLK